MAVAEDDWKFIGMCMFSIAANVFQLLTMALVPTTKHVQGKVVARKAMCDILLACSILAQLWGGEFLFCFAVENFTPPCAERSTRLGVLSGATAHSGAAFVITFCCRNFCDMLPWLFACQGPVVNCFPVSTYSSFSSQCSSQL